MQRCRRHPACGQRKSAAAADFEIPAGASEIAVAGEALVADVAAALYWPAERLLVVADLHLEKGSAFAARGMLLPPYDTAATFERLAHLMSRYAPRTVVALGDNFHDGGGPGRLVPADRAALFALQRGRNWIWIAGNHDPDPGERIGGVFARSLALGALVFRHEPLAEQSPGEIAGHLHPCARIHRRGRVVTRRCFASDGRRVVMPAFGAYTGGSISATTRLRRCSMRAPSRRMCWDGNGFTASTRNGVGDIGGDSDPSRRRSDIRSGCGRRLDFCAALLRIDRRVIRGRA